MALLCYTVAVKHSPDEPIAAQESKSDLREKLLPGDPKTESYMLNFAAEVRALTIHGLLAVGTAPMDAVIVGAKFELYLLQGDGGMETSDV